MQRRLKRMIVGLVASLSIGWTAQAMDLPKAVSVVPSVDYGDIIVDHDGMSLYWFTEDDTNISNCYGDCEKQWPILEAKTGAQAIGAFDLFTREDGRMQWSYQGRPLYFWEKDKKPGDVTGHGFKREWYVAKPDGSKARILRKKKTSYGGYQSSSN